MKNVKYILTALLLSAVVPMQAQQSKFEEDYTWSLGGQIGVQTGGAIPIPLDALSDKESAVHVYMSIHSLLALKGSYKLSPHWRLFGELSYAASGFVADARVTNQRIKETGSDGVIQEKYFTGVTRIEQSFSFFEVPVYARYDISSRSKLVLGVYGAYQTFSEFETTAVKGFVGVHPGTVEAPVTDPVRSDFSGDLHQWDIGFLAGYEFAILSRLNAGVRVNFSPFDIFSAGVDYFDYTMHHLRGAVTLSYEFWRN